MIKNYFFFLFLVLAMIFYTNKVYSNEITVNDLIKTGRYSAIVSGKMVSKEVKKLGTYYFTEYKLKPKKFLYKSDDFRFDDIITVHILGADFPEKGFSIVSSVSPAHIPINKNATFLLEETLKEDEDAYTISRGGVINEKRLGKTNIGE